jgi:hypothetical protein
VAWWTEFSTTARAAHPVDAFLHDFVAGIAQPLASFDQEVDDFGGGHVQQRRHLRTRMHRLVEIEPGRREGDAQIARAVGLVRSEHGFAAQEEGGGDDRVGGRGGQFGLQVHATPLT